MYVKVAFVPQFERKAHAVGQKMQDQPPSHYEQILRSPLTRLLFRSLAASDGKQRCGLERVFRSYNEKNAPLTDKVRYFVPHQLINAFARFSGTDRQVLRDKVFGHPPTARTLINTAASIAHYGLTRPQRYVAPVIVVWNITQACNLSCSHCYQDAQRRLPDELDQDEQLRVVDEMADKYVSMLAFAGGEPLMSKCFWETCRHAAKRGLHVTVATNGTLLTETNVGRLREAGIKLIEISLDSVDPSKHDRFRGAGAWNRTVQGIRNAVAQSAGGSDYRVSIASTMTQMNHGEVSDLVQFAEDLGAHNFNAFNFIPTGRGRNIATEDLTPEQRETVLDKLYEYLKANRIGIMCTAPQFGRVCVEKYHTAPDPVAVGHGSAGRCKDVAVLTQYVGGCGAGRCYCAIQPDGKVTPCVFMPLVVGDLRKESLIDIWLRSPDFVALSDRSDRTGHCRICKTRFQCGGCRARAYNYFGDFRAPDPGCVYNRKAWNEIRVMSKGRVARIQSS
jgi:radical SAM protein with 4Fe4S-binding SPASM domain